jgi:glycosyltransferase involved in cell wall biosynthesis
MRILVDIRHLAHPNPSGVGEYTIELLRALFQLDQNNHYTLFSTGRRKPDLDTLFPNRTNRVEHKHVSIPNKLLNARMSSLGHPTINWLIKKEIDLIFLPNLNIAPLPTNVPTVMTVHDLSWKIFPEFYSAKMQAWHKATKPDQLMKRIDHFCVPSSCTKQDLTRLFSTDPNIIHTIPHGVHPRYSSGMQARDHGVRSRHKLPKNFVLFVGTLEPRKNIIALIEGIKEYREMTGDDLHLVLVGKWGWRARRIKKRIWKRDAKHWIHERGYVPQDELPAIYRSAQALVWPSIYEGFGLPVLEAMACGTPVITSHTSSLPEITKGEALLIDPYNSTDIACALKGLLGSIALRDTLSAKGVKVAQTYTWEQSALQTLRVFQMAENKR